MCRASVLGGQLQDVKRKPLCARRASAGSLLELILELARGAWPHKRVPNCLDDRAVGSCVRLFPPAWNSSGDLGVTEHACGKNGRAGALRRKALGDLGSQGIHVSGSVAQHLAVGKHGVSKGSTTGPSR